MQENKQSVTQKTWFIILFLIVFWPVGLFFMWKNKKFSKVVRIIITVVLAIGVIGYIGGLGNSDDKVPTSPSTEVSETETTDVEPAVEKEEPEMTKAQENAYKSAKSYLDFSAFSRDGLIQQLSSEYGEGYKKEDAEFAVNLLEENNEVDWNEQAYKSAKSYLEFQSFSLDGLIEQLESEYGEGFTHEQAVYGANKAYEE